MQVPYYLEQWNEIDTLKDQLNQVLTMVCGYHKEFKEQHGIRYQLYVVHRVKVELHQLHHHYRERFGIETSYRLKNYCRIHTTSKNPVARLLFNLLRGVQKNNVPI